MKQTLTPTEWAEGFAIDVRPTQKQINTFMGRCEGRREDAPIIQDTMIALLRKHKWYSVAECLDNWFKPDPVRPYATAAVFRGLFRGPVDHISLAVSNDRGKEDVAWGYHPRWTEPASRTTTISYQDTFGYWQGVTVYDTVFEMLWAFDAFIRDYVRKD
jgi:hypothetical protein